MTHSPEIQCLCRDIEQHVGQKLQSPADFQLLIHQIWEKQHAVLSLSTIKRLWGYVESNAPKGILRRIVEKVKNIRLQQIQTAR